jgi:hypothetical protein
MRVAPRSTDPSRGGFLNGSSLPRSVSLSLHMSPTSSNGHSGRTTCTGRTWPATLWFCRHGGRWRILGCIAGIAMEVRKVYSVVLGVGTELRWPRVACACVWFPFLEKLDW